METHFGYEWKRVKDNGESGIQNWKIKLAVQRMILL